jgi:hypothetical protein
VTSPAVAIFADMLLQIKLQHTETSSLLYKEEKNLSIDVKNDNKKIISMLRDDRLHQETQKLRSDILHAEGGDEVEVELCIEEWLTKLANLDNSYAQLSQNFARQRASLKHSGGTTVAKGPDESDDIDIEDSDVGDIRNAGNPDIRDPNIRDPIILDPNTRNLDIYDPDTRDLDIYDLDTRNPDIRDPYVEKMNNQDNNNRRNTHETSRNPTDAIFSDFFEIRTYLKATKNKDGFNTPPKISNNEIGEFLYIYMYIYIYVIYKFNIYM